MTYARNFSLGQDFMDKKVDDILFACMAYMTHYDKERQELYLNDSDLTDVRKYVKTLVPLTSRQITAHIKILVEKNLVLRDEERNRYVIRNFIHGQYYIVPCDILWYLIHTASKHVIQIYVYLADKYVYKKKNDRLYEFTLKELAEALGYSSHADTRTNAVIQACLVALAKQGIISAHKKWFYTNGHQSQVLVLDNLALNTQDQYFIEVQNALKIAGQVEQEKPKVRETNCFNLDGPTEITQSNAQNYTVQPTEITQSNDVFYTRSPIEPIESKEPIDSASRNKRESVEQKETPYDKETIDRLNSYNHSIDISNDYYYCWGDK